MINSLSQTLLKIAAPGVADFYQGSELWDLRLVDPDNRGPIDFAVRKSALADLADTERADCPCRLKNLLENWHDGRIKMYLIWKALRFRREQQQLFREGEFIPLQTTGLRAPNMIAFLRKLGTEYALIAVPRWLSQMAAVDQNLQCHGLHDAAQDEALRNQGVAGGREAGNGAPASFDWTDTAIMLPKEIPSRWNSILTPKKLAAETNPDGAFVMANDLFQNFPVGLFRAQ
jgi:(1->4)-alpha-D-glucan 1-alpha-D-glucosylmutase